mgnify:CR=1 FL=1
MNQSENIITHYLKESYPFWNKLNSREQSLLISNSTMIRYEKDSFIYSRDEDCLGVFIVLEGQIRIYIQSEDSREITLFRLAPDGVCTLSASCLIQEITFDIQIEAEESSKILLSNTPAIRTLIDHNIYVENYIYKHTTEHFSDVMWAFGQILFSSFDKRLAAYLEDERIRSGSCVLKTTHEQIAKNLGSAREVVSRMLKYFEKEGIVLLSRGTITILDTGKLRSYL